MLQLRRETFWHEDFLDLNCRRVCKNFFLFTFDIGKKAVEVALEKKRMEIGNRTDQRGRHVPETKQVQWWIIGMARRKNPRTVCCWLHADLRFTAIPQICYYCTVSDDVINGHILYHPAAILEVPSEFLSLFVNVT